MPTRPKVSPAIVIATLALVVASSGSAYAVAKIDSSDIKNNSIQSKDIKNGTLKKKDFAPNTLTAGPQGEVGPPGADGVGRWLLVDKDGAIIAQSGGFSINAAYATLENTAPEGDNSLRAAGNVYINANEDLSNNGITVSIALQNVTEQNDNGNTNGRAAGPDVNPEFSGEITTTVCGVAGIVGCAPPGANNRNHFVVSPRMSDGSLTFASDPITGNNTHKRFYVIITGDSTDFVSPEPAIPPMALP